MADACCRSGGLVVASKSLKEVSVEIAHSVRSTDSARPFASASVSFFACWRGSSRWSAWRSLSARRLGVGHSAASLWQLLKRPLVAVRVFEVDEPAPVEVVDVAGLDPVLDELRTRGLDIGDHHIQ